MIGVWAKASKEKKSLEDAFNAGFDVIFNYGYGCCAFAHNICGSEPVIPYGMLDTSKPLPLEFFINPQCPPSAALRVHTTDPDVDVKEAGKSLLVDEVQLGTQFDSPVRVTRRMRNLTPLAGTRDFCCRQFSLVPFALYPQLSLSCN